MPSNRPPSDDLTRPTTGGSAPLVETEGLVPVSDRRFYLRVRTRFLISVAVALAWAGFSLWLSIPWIEDLASYVTLPIAILIVAGIALIPGYLNMQLIMSIAARPPAAARSRAVLPADHAAGRGVQRGRLDRGDGRLRARVGLPRRVHASSSPTTARPTNRGDRPPPGRARRPARLVEASTRREGRRAQHGPRHHRDAARRDDRRRHAPAAAEPPSRRLPTRPGSARHGRGGGLGARAELPCERPDAHAGVGLLPRASPPSSASRRCFRARSSRRARSASTGQRRSARRAAGRTGSARTSC